LIKLSADNVRPEEAGALLPKGVQE
jgi:hypothetical protein